MRILWYVFSYATADPWIQSLRDLTEHELHVERYDTYHATDRGFLDAYDRIRPDVVIATLTAGGPHIPDPSTLGKINAKCPVVFLSGDLSDPPWHPYLKTYRDAGGFSLAVNFDGNDEWPKQSKDFTCLCPISPSYYKNAPPLSERSIPFGFMGTFSSPSRAEILSYLSEHAGLVIRSANNVSTPYQQYADFMMQCRIVVNIPISGSDAVRQVKARVVEAGLAGCMLFDHASSPARNWFKPAMEFGEYLTPEGLAEIINALTHPTMQISVHASLLHKAILERHHPAIMWNRIFAALA